MGQRHSKQNRRFEEGYGGTDPAPAMAATVVEEIVFRVQYLGSVMLNKEGTGLGAVQKPLKELYLDTVRKSGTGLKTQERQLKVREEGILMTYQDSSLQTRHGFYDMTSLHFAEAVRFVAAKGQDKRLRGVFEPLDPNKRHVVEKFMTVLDKKYNYLAERPHPPLFVCILRRPTGVKALDCHVFIMGSDKEAVQLSFELERTKKSIDMSPASAGPFDQGDRTSQKSAQNTPGPYRPMDYPSGNTSNQTRYELRDDHFRPASYEGYQADSHDGYPHAQQPGPHPTQQPGPQLTQQQHESKFEYMQYGGGSYGLFSLSSPEQEEVQRRNRAMGPNESGPYGSSDPRRVVSEYAGDRHPPYAGNDRHGPPPQQHRFSSDDAFMKNKYGYNYDAQKQHGIASKMSSDGAPYPGPGPHPALDRRVSPDTSAFQDRRDLPPTAGRGGPPVMSPKSPLGPTGPMFSASNLESRQEGDRSRGSVEIFDSGETAKNRPVAKVPPHMVGGVKVLPTLPGLAELKPLAKKSPVSPDQPPLKHTDQERNPQYPSPYPSDIYYADKNRPSYPDSRAGGPGPGPQQGGYYKYEDNAPPFGQDNWQDPKYSYDKPGYDYRESGYTNQNHGYPRRPETSSKPHDPYPYGYKQNEPEQGGAPYGMSKDKEIANMMHNVHVSDQQGGQQGGFEHSLGYYP